MHDEPRVALLWARETAGLYSNTSFDDLYSFIGHNNGNLAFVHAIRSHIANKTVFLPWHSSAQRLRSEADLIVIPCANQLGSHTDLGGLADKLKASELPIVAIGLGAQSRSDSDDVELKLGTLEWLQCINEQRPTEHSNIYARGLYTTSQIKKLGIEDVVLGGCPSFFLNSACDLGHRIKRNFQRIPRTICVAGAHQSWAKCMHIEQQLVSLISDTYYPGSYVPQSMADMIKISRNEFASIEPSVLEKIRKFIAPHLDMNIFQDWCRRFARSFYDVPAWMDHLRNHDLTIGARYHGVALALQAERMGLTVTIDTRTKELCEQTGVPNITAEDLSEPVTRKNLFERLVDFDAEHYDQLRRMRASDYVAFLQRNLIRPSEDLVRLAQG